VAATRAIERVPGNVTEWRPTGDLIEEWSLIPRARVREFPDYIPATLRADYREACLVRDLSPKASATLSRRVLQGMITDYLGVKGQTLHLQMENMRPLVPKEVWDAIDGVRKVGNVGAHMEQDINVIVDVEPAEAQLLIGLIELLFKEWYMARHEREENLRALKALGAAKEAATSVPK